MSVTWYSSAPPPDTARAPGHWRRVTWRGGRIALVIGAGVVATLVLRLAERLLHRRARPWSTAPFGWASRRILAILGIAWSVAGRPAPGPGAVVANHVSWLDVFVLRAAMPVTFVAKAEVAGWPGIGALSRLVGTVFITRDARAARSHAALLQARLAAGWRLLVFPEGTSTDGLRVRPFKSTLFEALHGAGDAVQVQPVTLVYAAPEGADARVYGYWGEMTLGPHLLAVLGMPRQGRVRVVCHAPLTAGDFAGRKALAAACERAVRAGMPEGRRGP